MREIKMPKLVTILFNDGTWYNCYEEEIEQWLKHHEWKCDCYKSARIVYQDFDNLHLINLEE